MYKNTPKSPSFFDKRQGKYSKILAQKQKVFKSFYSQPKTMLMVEVETGIMRSNICWFVRELRKRNNIMIVKKGVCPISKSTGVQYLTTNPELFPYC
jgi:ABC-type Na+ transport system ATPase subunit NatA